MYFIESILKYYISIVKDLFPSRSYGCEYSCYKYTYSMEMCFFLKEMWFWNFQV